MSLRVLSVASEVFPLVKTGGLADVAGALPAALARRGHRGAHAPPRLSRGAGGAARGRGGRTRFADLFGGPARLLAGAAPAGSTCSCSTRRTSTTAPGNPYVGARRHATGPTTRCASPRSPRCAARDRRAARRRRFVPDVVHAHDWQAGLAPAYLHYGGGPRPRTVMTVHNLAFQGQFPRDAARRRSACRRTPSRIDGVEYLRRDRLPEGRARARRPHHHGVADLRRGDPHAGGRHGPRRAAAQRARRAHRHPQRHRRRGLEPGDRPAPRRALRRAAPRAAAPPTRRRCRRASASPSTPAAPLFGVVSRLTWQKGMDLLLDALPALVAQRRAARAARHRRAGARGSASPRRPRRHPGPRRRASSATTRRSRT